MQKPLKHSPSDFRPAHKGYPCNEKPYFQYFSTKLRRESKEDEDRRAERIYKWINERSKGNPLFQEADSVITVEEETRLVEHSQQVFKRLRGRTNPFL